MRGEREREREKVIWIHNFTQLQPLERDREMSENPKPSVDLPWILRISLPVVSAIGDFTRRSDGTVNRRLINYLQATTKLPTEPVNGVKISDITVDATRNLWFRLFAPTKTSADTSLPVIVFFHGGGFTFCSADTKSYDAVCRHFARKIPAVVVSVNYRLSPEHRFPAQYEDGFDTLKFLDERKGLEDFPANANLTHCFLAGDSAGGNMAHHVARQFAESENEFQKLKVIGLIAIQPFFGGEERTESEIRLQGAPLISMERTDWHWKAFLPVGSDRNHEAVNVFGPNSIDISGLKSFPSTLLFVGGFDPLQDWQRRYYEGLKRSGKEVRLVEYPNAIHAFYIFPVLPESSLLLEELKDFIGKQVQKF